LLIPRIDISTSDYLIIDIKSDISTSKKSILDINFNSENTITDINNIMYKLLISKYVIVDIKTSYPGNE